MLRSALLQATSNTLLTLRSALCQVTSNTLLMLRSALLQVTLIRSWCYAFVGILDPVCFSGSRPSSLPLKMDQDEKDRQLLKWMNMIRASYADMRTLCLCLFVPWVRVAVYSSTERSTRPPKRPKVADAPYTQWQFLNPLFSATVSENENRSIQMCSWMEFNGWMLQVVVLGRSWQFLANLVLLWV